MSVTLSSAARDETQDIAGRKVWLVEFPDPSNGTHYLTNYSTDIDWSSNTYTAFDLRVPSNTVSTTRQLNSTTLQISNIDHKAQIWYTDNSGLEGETVKLITLSPDATGSGDDIRKKQYQIDTYQWNERWGQIGLVPFYDFLVNKATEPISRDHCGKFVPRAKKLQRRHIKEAQGAEG